MIMRYIFCILFTISTIFPQDICNGVCLSEQEAENMFYNINKCENDLQKSLKINENLNSQIYIYIQQTKMDSLIIEDYKKQIEIQEEMIKTIKPKWYDNKYLWYGMGVASMILPIWGLGQVSK